LRNVLNAIGNSENADLVGTVIARLEEENPLVRGAAVWALRQLDRNTFEREKQARSPTEQDQDVRAEWERINA